MRRGNTTLASLAPVTIAILGIDIALYFVAAMRSESLSDFSSAAILSLGALQRELIWEGDWARLIAPIFLHLGFLHLLLNASFLYSFGPAAEVHFGSSNFGTLYLLSGIVGCCFSATFGGSISAGASGALFGILAAELVAQIASSPVVKYAWRRKEVRTSAAWLVILFLIGVSGLMGPVDNWGHFGGIVGGGLLAAFFELWRKRRRLGLSLILLLLLGIGGLVCLTRWSIYSPAYHVHMAWLAEQDGRESNAEHELEKAREWARIWGKEQTIDNLIAGHRRGFWGLDEARKYGYAQLERVAAGR